MRSFFCCWVFSITDVNSSEGFGVLITFVVFILFFRLYDIVAQNRNKSHIYTTLCFFLLFLTLCKKVGCWTTHLCTICTIPKLQPRTCTFSCNNIKRIQVVLFHNICIVLLAFHAIFIEDTSL